jgi:hypothetical protein
MVDLFHLIRGKDMIVILFPFRPTRVSSFEPGAMAGYGQNIRVRLELSKTYAYAYVEKPTIVVTSRNLPIAR